MRLAVIGAGQIVADFLPHASAVDGLELVAICGNRSSREKLERIAGTHGIRRVYVDYDECLRDPGIDTVWIALPNALHHGFSRRALLAGKNVVCEKPFVLRAEELAELRRLAEQKSLLLVEAISNQYLANYRWIIDNVDRLGDLRVVQCEYSQYSSRYDAFREGTVLPAFDPALGGGALMDLGIYALHVVVGLLGRPDSVEYSARIERGVDTSGVVTLRYDGLTAVCICAKDSPGPSRTKIQGTEGSIVVDGAPNMIPSVELHLRGAETERIDRSVHGHRMVEEFQAFTRMIRDRDLAERDRRLDHSAAVLAVATAALASAGIVFA